MLKLIPLIAGSFLLISCASAPINDPAIVQNMSCEELGIEIQNLNKKVTSARSSSETNRAIDTGSSVAVQGASIAGVPYIGAIFSIGKTLLNHNKQTSKFKAQQAEEQLYKLQYFADEKGCQTSP